MSFILNPFYRLAAHFVSLSVFQGAMADQTGFSGYVTRYITLPLGRLVTNLFLSMRGIPLRHDPLDPSRVVPVTHLLDQFSDPIQLDLPGGELVEMRIFSSRRFNEWRQTASPQQIESLSFPTIPLEEQVPAAERLVFRCQGFGRRIEMDKRMIALHLAKGFDYAVFNWGSDPSLARFSAVAEAALARVRREGYALEDITAIGSCRASFVVASLLERHCQGGLNGALFDAPPSLAATIACQPFPSNWIGRLGLAVLEEELDFDTLSRLRRSAQGYGKLAIIGSVEDTTLPPDSLQMLQEAGGGELILERETGAGDAHYRDRLLDPEVRDQYFRFL